MILNFKSYLRVLEEYSLSSDYAGGGYLPTTWTGSEVDNTQIATGHDPSTHPGIDVTTPQVTRRSRLASVNYTKPLIELQLEDGTQLRMTRAEFERAGGKSFVPRQSVLTVVFQRHPGYAGADASQVLSVKCDNVPYVRTQR